MNRLRLFVLVVVLIVGSYGTSLAIKGLLKIPRPCIEDNTCPSVDNPYDIPSSHTTVAFSVAVFLSLIWKKKWIQSLLLSGAVIIGIERWVTHYHSIFGVLSGVLLGTLVGVLWYVITIHLDQT